MEVGPVYRHQPVAALSIHAPLQHHHRHPPEQGQAEQEHHFRSQSPCCTPLTSRRLTDTNLAQCQRSSTSVRLCTWREVCWRVSQLPGLQTHVPNSHTWLWHCHANSGQSWPKKRSSAIWCRALSAQPNAKLKLLTIETETRKTNRNRSRITE